MIRKLIVIVILIGFLVAAGAFAVSAVSPVLPGSSLFGVQSALEQLAAKRGKPEQVLSNQLGLVETRTTQLQLLRGTMTETGAIEALGKAVDRASLAYAQLETQSMSDYKDAFLTSMTRARATLRRNGVTLAERWLYEKLSRLSALFKDGIPTSDAIKALIALPPQEVTPTASQNPTTEPVGYQHASFDLSGGHANLTCENCHGKDNQTLTPGCATCHADRRPAEDHFSTECERCHTPAGWSQAAFDHASVPNLVCADCHADRAPEGHYPLACQTCHTPGSWAGAKFNHAAELAVNCQGCHASTAPANHWALQCSTCHIAGGQWSQVSFNHSAVDASNCASCHSSAAPTSHYAGQCSACHNPAGWNQVSFNHAAAGATDCVGCHAGNAPSNHYDMQCSTCHNTSGWLPADFKHEFNINHNGANGVCSTCHPAGPPETDCRACHDSKEGGEDDDD